MSSLFRVSAGCFGRSASSVRSGSIRAHKLLPTLILFLVIAWQSFVIQTHVHPLATRSGTVAFQAAGHFGRTIADAPGSDQATCPICQQLAQVGHLLAPTPASLSEAFAAMTPAQTPTLDLWERRDRSHAWLGRGPPHRS